MYEWRLVCESAAARSIPLQLSSAPSFARVGSPFIDAFTDWFQISLVRRSGARRNNYVLYTCYLKPLNNSTLSHSKTTVGRNRQVMIIMWFFYGALIPISPHSIHFFTTSFVIFSLVCFFSVIFLFPFFLYTSSTPLHSLFLLPTVCLNRFFFF